jgi:hypothetical protein
VRLHVGVSGQCPLGGEPQDAGQVQPVGGQRADLLQPVGAVMLVPAEVLRRGVADALCAKKKECSLLTRKHRCHSIKTNIPSL